jgi:iron(III) transport system permease protein
MQKTINYLSKISLFNLFIAIFLLLPIISIFLTIFTIDKNIISQFMQFNLLVYIKNTIIILTLVLFFAFFIASISAYFIVRFDIFGKKLITFFCLMPLAIPAYILGYAYVIFFEYNGVLFNILGIYINIFNIVTLSFIISLSLFGYLFVLLKSSFINIFQTVSEDLENFSTKEVYVIFKLLLPLSKFAIFTGSGLVLMEAFNEYGLVSYFGFNTISSIVVKLLYGLDNYKLALFISAIILVIIFLWLMVFSKFNNISKQSFTIASRMHNYKVKPSIKMLVIIYSWFAILFIASLGMPVITLLYKSSKYLDLINIQLLSYILNTLILGGAVALLTTILAFIIIYISNLYKNNFNKITLKLLILGYATPGTIIGLGVLLLQQFEVPFFIYIQSTTLLILIYALVLRFIYISNNSLGGYYLRYSNINEISLSLNSNNINTLLKVNLPLLKKPLLFSFLLVFLDVVKELPLTLLLKPNNFNTLAVQTWYYANNESLSQSSIYALSLIFISGFVVWIFNR